MNLVTDTHALVWYVSNRHRRLSRRALAAFRDAEAGRRTVHVPTVVLMEIALLEQAGHLRLSYREMREQLGLRPGLPVEPLLPADVDEARGLGALRDPFDRLIAGTSLRLGLPLLTADDAIAVAPSVRTVW